MEDDTTAPALSGASATSPFPPKKMRVADDDKNDDRPSKGPPEYDGSALARAALAHPYFYNDDAGIAEFCRGRREKAFDDKMTVEDVRIEYMTKEGGATRLMQATSGTEARFEAYFAQALRSSSLEEQLAAEEVVTLDPSNEVQWFLERRVAGGVPSSSSVFETQAAKGPTKSYPLCFVMGSSGSGKTFFSLEHLRTFLTEDSALPSVTLYLKAATHVGKGLVDYASEDAPAIFMDQVKKALGNVIKDTLKRGWDQSVPLEMHVCLVIDEAGSTATKGYFDNRANVLMLLTKLKSSNLARSATLVICGTGLLPQVFSSDQEAFYFHMKPWTSTDLEKVLQKHLDKQSKELPPRIAEAVSNIPLLDALSTNGRSAYFMVEGIVKATLQTSAISHLGWQAHLSALIPDIVNSVVFQYSDSNAIKGLDDGQRRRVAAWIFGALSQLKQGELKIPEFPGLNAAETYAALQLFHLNVQLSGNTIGFVPGEEFSASVTPALTIVLFNMAGVFTNLVSGWRGEEEVAALYAAKQAILERWLRHMNGFRDNQRTFVPNRDSMNTAEFSAALEGLGKSAEYEVSRSALEANFLEALMEVTVYRLQKQLQSSKSASVYIPIVSRHSILVNAERASFADVIAPKTFIQTQHTSNPQEKCVDVHLTSELQKCRLLKKVDKSDRALCGLLALWDETLSAEVSISTEAEVDRTVSQGTGLVDTKSKRRPVQGSKAFPENLIKGHAASDGIKYAEILSTRQWKGTDYVLPQCPDTLNVTFVLSTNAESVRLILSEEKTPLLDKNLLFITEESLNDMMQVDKTKLPSDDNRALWALFQGRLAQGVNLQFLFTRSRS